MNDRELASIVSEMRQAQNNYFKTRAAEDLERSKRLEKQVDTIVADILGDKQSLFNPQMRGNSEGI